MGEMVKCECGNNSGAIGADAVKVWNQMNDRVALHEWCRGLFG